MRKQLKPKKPTISKERTSQSALAEHVDEPEEDGIKHDMDDNSRAQLASAQGDDATSQASAAASAGGAASSSKKKKKKKGGAGRGLQMLMRRVHLATSGHIADNRDLQRRWAGKPAR